MNHSKELISLGMLLLFFFAACNLLKTQAASPTSVPGENATALGQTEAAESTLLATMQGTGIPPSTEGGFPVASQTSTAILATTDVLTPTRSPLDIQGTGALPCYRAEWLNDVTIPDGTIFSPAANFTKIWRLLNTGSCAWNSSFNLIFDYGAAMGGPTAVNLPGIVSPGQTVDLSVGLTAPNAPGTYQGFWELETDRGAIFGLSPDHHTPFWVRITVRAAATQQPFSVQDVVTRVDTSSLTTACPAGHEFTFTANITTNMAGTVNYHWEFSDGSETSLKSLRFDTAGTQTVTATWDLGTTGMVNPNPFDGWARLFADAPNDQAFDRVDFALACTR